MQRLRYRGGLAAALALGWLGSPSLAHAQEFLPNLIDDQLTHGQGLAIADVDGDGDQDVVAAYSSTDGVFLYVNGSTSGGGGDGSSWARVTVAPATTIVAVQVAVADFDGDSDLDVAATGLFDRSCTFCSAGVVRWYENPGDVFLAWTEHTIAASLWGAKSIAAADLTGDNLPDLVVGANAIGGNGNGLYWFRNASAGTAWSGPLAIDATLLQVETVLVQDVDADGVTDVTAVGRDSAQIAWWENLRTGPDPNPAFSKHAIDAPTQPYGLAFANLDGDGALELIATSQAGLAWYDPPANPANPWSATTLDASFGAGDNVRLFAADLSGDGLVDLAVSSGAVTELRWYRREVGGTWTARTLATGFNGLSFVAGGDVTGDGRPDLATSTYNFSATDRIDWWRNLHGDHIFGDGFE